MYYCFFIPVFSSQLQAQQLLKDAVILQQYSQTGTTAETGEDSIVWLVKVKATEFDWFAKKYRTKATGSWLTIGLLFKNRRSFRLILTWYRLATTPTV